MYQCSDSDSSDSDRGIRYKTDSTRDKSKDDSSSSHSLRKENYTQRDRSVSSCNKGRSTVDYREKKYIKKINNTTSNESSSRDYSPPLNKKATYGPTLPLKKNIDETATIELKDDTSKKQTSSIREDNYIDDKGVKSRDKDKKNATFGHQNQGISSCTNQSKIIGPAFPPDGNSNEADLVKTGPLTEDKYIPSHLQKLHKTNSEPAPTESCLGPALPPHLTKSMPEKNTIPNKQIIGPTLPPYLRETLLEGGSDDENGDIYGPVPEGAKYSKAHVELEERALQLKIDQLDPKGKDEPRREEWMVELPAAQNKNFGLGPRQFRAKEGPDLSDRSSWTDTPQDKEKRKAGKEELKVDHKKEAELNEIRLKNKEQATIAKKNKRSRESLLEIHAKKMKNDKKDGTGPSIRTPFNRETDLQVNRFDEAQKKAVLKKAQLLDCKFSAGESKFL